MFQDGPFGRSLQKLSYIPDERLDILETIKEKDEALLELSPLREPCFGHSRLQRTLHAFREFRSHVNKIENNMDVQEKHLQRKIQERNYNTSLKTFQTAFFIVSTKIKTEN